MKLKYLAENFKPSLKSSFKRCFVNYESVQFDLLMVLKSALR